MQVSRIIKNVNTAIKPIKPTENNLLRTCYVEAGKVMVSEAVADATGLAFGQVYPPLKIVMDSFGFLYRLQRNSQPLSRLLSKNVLNQTVRENIFNLQGWICKAAKKFYQKAPGIK